MVTPSPTSWDTIWGYVLYAWSVAVYFIQFAWEFVCDNTSMICLFVGFAVYFDQKREAKQLKLILCELHTMHEEQIAVRNRIPQGYGLLTV